MTVVKLMNSSLSIKFEECFEGTNALDFQLVSYLGYLMKNDETGVNEYIIMTNDNGFDSAVNFWKKRGFPVSKINVNYCKIKIHQKTKALPAPADERKSEDKEDIISEKAIAEKAENSPENADGNVDSAVQADKVPETAMRNQQTRMRAKMQIIQDRMKKSLNYQLWQLMQKRHRRKETLTV